MDASDETSLLGFDFAQIDNMDPGELDALPFGAIQLDREGSVIAFNAYEQQLSQLTREKVIGRKFFTDVAPCADVREFHGRFLEGVANGALHAKFRYHFAFKQNPRDVQITLFYSDITRTVWVLVQPV